MKKTTAAASPSYLFGFLLPTSSKSCLPSDFFSQGTYWQAATGRAHALVQTPPRFVPNWIRAPSVPVRIKEVVAGFCHQINEVTTCQTKSRAHTYKKKTNKKKRQAFTPRSEKCKCLYFILVLASKTWKRLILCHPLVQLADNRGRNKPRGNKTVGMIRSPAVLVGNTWWHEVGVCT